MNRRKNHNPSLCGDCGRHIPADFSGPDVSPCPCGKREMSTLLFVPPREPEHDESLGSSAACFLNPDLPADQICSECGCMMNHLYDFHLGDDHFCVDCLRRMRAEKDPRVITFKTRYDLLAFYTSLAGFLVFWMSLVTAPIALALSAIQWKKPQSLVNKSRGYFIITILFSLLQCLGWVGLFVFLLYQWFGGTSE